jgi:plasmid stabilization system protein ParE
MRLCHTCLAPLILKHDEVLELSNLATLLNRAKHGVWVRERLRQGKIDGYWVPQVDDILRIATGLDYKTTVAKQRYFDHIYKATKVQRWPEQARQLRLKIVDVAKKLWDSPADLTAALGTESSSNVRRLRETFVPTSKLPQFLFPEHALYEYADYLPYDADSVWLDDPVNGIWHIHEMSVCMHDQVRISQMAHKMVRDLLSQKNKITTLCKAAHEYHVDRLRTSLQADTFLENLVTQYPRPDQAPQRLRVILSKLHLIKDQANHRIGLTPRGKAMAAAVLPKLLESACIVCPETQLLAPRGIDGVLVHMRRAHPDKFWYEKFSILG